MSARPTTHGRVALVSKPLGPPWNDGSSRLVAELLGALAEGDLGPSPRLRIFAKPGFQWPDESVESVEIRSSGASRNLEITRRLLGRWSAGIHHYFFAPHPSAVAVARLVSALSGAVPFQTICSQPRSFRRAGALCFGERVVALSRWTAERLVAGSVDAAQIGVIAPPLRPLEQPSAERIDAARRSIGFEKGQRLVIFPGDAEPGGGLRTLAQSIPEICRREPGVTFVIACRPKTPLAARSIRWAKELLSRRGAERSVKFVGEINDFQATLAAVDLCVLTPSSLYAKVDFPYALLEAMSLGVPAVVSSGTTLEELVTSGGGWLVPPRSPRVLASTLVAALSDRPALVEVGREAKRIVDELCDPRRIAGDYLELYREVTEGVL